MKLRFSLLLFLIKRWEFLTLPPPTTLSLALLSLLPLLLLNAAAAAAIDAVIPTGPPCELLPRWAIAAEAAAEPSQATQMRSWLAIKRRCYAGFRIKQLTQQHDARSSEHHHHHSHLTSHHSTPHTILNLISPSSTHTCSCSALPRNVPKLISHVNCIAGHAAAAAGVHSSATCCPAG